MVSDKRLGFPFRRLFFVAVVVIFGYVYYDFKQAENWQKTRTHKLFTDVGVYVYADKIRTSANGANNYLRETYPEYYEVVANVSQPYIELGRDMGIIIYNVGKNIGEVVIAKYPIIIEPIEAYAPGIVEQSRKAVGSVWSASVFYVDRSVNYLKNEVFVGQLSPENVQRLVVEAFNTTRQKATEYYHWVYEKVQTTIK